MRDSERDKDKVRESEKEKEREGRERGKREREERERSVLSDRGFRIYSMDHESSLMGPERGREGLLTHIRTQRAYSRIYPHTHTRAHLESLACASAALERGWDRGNIKRERLRRKPRPDRRGGAGGFGGGDGRLRSVEEEVLRELPWSRGGQILEGNA